VIWVQLNTALETVKGVLVFSLIAKRKPLPEPPFSLFLRPQISVASGGEGVCTGFRQRGGLNPNQSRLFFACAHRGPLFED
jgi:hypothetical protein